ncbi:MAG: sialidase family protein [bacterium]
MKCLLALLLAAGPALAAFGASVRVDTETRPAWACYHAAIAVGCSDSGPPPIYVAFENDSVPFTIQRSDIAFQRSTDAGRTWLAENIIIRQGNRFACYPDLKVARDGTIHLVFTDRIDGSKGNIRATRSTDGGATWSAPVQVDDSPSRVDIGWARLALDTADNLFCAWTDKRGAFLRVYSDVSTDGGATWGTDARVDDDTVSFNCYPPDAWVQPGSNDHLVVADAPVRGPSGIVIHSHFYRSTDAGRTWSPGVQLDTFSGVCRQPHVVADAGHVITDYTGNGYVNQSVTMARTFFEAGDSWGPQVLITELDTIYSSFTNGAKLAIDLSGTVHTALQFCNRQSFVYDVYYCRSDDHGLTWSERELVNDAVAADQWDPDIAVDADGSAYVVWQDMRNPKAQVWFATNAWTGILAPGPAPLPRLACAPNPFRAGLAVTGVPAGRAVEVFDAAGRRVRLLPSRDGRARWDGRGQSGAPCPPGVYIIHVPGARPERVTRLR